MYQYLIYGIAGPIVLTLAIICYILFTSRQKEEEAPIQIKADAGTVVTVRKVGGVTRVEVSAEEARRVEEDYYEALSSESTTLERLDVEDSRKMQPELYDEYMSDSTTAIRKMEILEVFYDMGLQLPMQPGLYEEYRREVARMERNAAQDARELEDPVPEPVEEPEEEEEDGGLKGLEVDDQLRNMGLEEFPAIPDVDE